MEHKCMYKKIVVGILVCLILSTVMMNVAHGSPNVNEPWPVVGGNLENTGMSSVDTSHVSGDILWNATIEEGLTVSDTSPVVDSEGNLYFSVSRVTISIDVMGNRRWIFRCDSGYLSPPSLGPGGTVYVGSREGMRLYALDREDGREIWRFDTTGWVTTPPIIGNDNIIYFGTHFQEDYSTRVYALRTNGQQRWVYTLPESDEPAKINSRVAIGENGWIYFGSRDHHVYALNRYGELQWKRDPAPAWGVSTQILSSPALHEGIVYIGLINGLSALDAETGDTVWHFPDERHEEREFGDNVAVWGSPAVGPDGTIYFGATFTVKIDSAFAFGRIYGLRPDGRVRWHMDTREIIMSATPAIGREGTVYMGTNDGQMIAFEAGGTPKWNHTVGRGVDSSPAIGSDGTVYLITASPIPTVYAFTGEVESDDTDLPMWIIGVSIAAVAIVALYAVVIRKRKKV